MAESKKSKKSTKKAPKKSKKVVEGPSVVKPEKEVARLRGILESLDTEIKEKELALIALAHLGTEEANDVIEGFILDMEALGHVGVDEMREWAILALEEGEFFASVPTSPEEEEWMIKEVVYQDYMDRYCDLEAKIEEVEEEIAKRKYEFEIVKRLKKKAKTKRAKEDWNIEEIAQREILGWEEGRKEKLEEELRIVEAIMDEIESELKNKL